MKNSLTFIVFIIPAWLLSQTGLYQPLGNGMYNGMVNSIVVDSSDNKLYLAGSFNLLGGSISGFVAKWDGSTWDSIPELPNTITTFKYLDGELYAYGDQSIWKKDAGIWSEIASVNGFQGVTCIEKYNGNLIIMGSFDTLNGQKFNCFALYDGSNLFPFSNYMSWPINGRYFKTAAIFNNELYVGGMQADSSGTLQGIMKWNGTQWVSIGTSIVGTFGGVSKLLIYDNKLFIGGSFDKASGNVGNALFSFDGTSFNDLAGGLHLTVYDMTVHNNELFIVGPCKTDTDREFKGFLSFNGNDFCFYDSVPCNTSPGQLFSRITFYNDSLIVGGANLAFNGDTMKYIAKFEGDYTTPIGCEQVIGIVEINNDIESLNIYPNPASDQITIEFDLAETKNTSMEIKNVLGQTIKKDNSDFFVGTNNIKIDVSKLPKGLYFVQLVNGSTQVTQKFIIE
jgi:hypothetical protein